MNKLCSIAKDSSTNGYSKKDIQELKEKIYTGIELAVERSDLGRNIPLLRSYIKKLLQSIGDSYNNSLLNLISDIVEKVFNTEYQDYLVLLPELGIKNTISKRYRKAVKDYINDDYYAGVDSLEVLTTKTQFLDATFGVLAGAKNKLKLEVSMQLLNTFIIDRNNGTLVRNAQDMNNNVRKAKQALFSKIVEYLKSVGVEIPGQLYDVDGNYTGVLDNQLTKLTLFRFAVINQSDIDKYQYSSNESDLRFYEAFKAWFTLTNFDNFVDLLLGEAISIEHSAKNKFVDGDNYEFNTKGSSMITTWRTSEEVYLDAEINKLALLLINTTPKLKYNIDESTGNFIKFDDFFRVITKIKNLVYKPETSRITFNASDTGVAEFTAKYLEDKSMYEDTNLRTLINKIRLNPQKYLRLVLLALNDPKMDVMTKLGFTPDEKDLCYSIFKGIFDPKNKTSIKSIQNNYKYNVKNYYSLITLVADTMFDVNHVLYYQNEDGTITMRSLRDLDIDDVQRDLETTILRGNSRRRPGDFNKLELEPYKGTPINKGTTLDGISASITLASGKLLQIKLNDLGETISYTVDGNIMIREDINNYWEDPNLQKFVLQQLKIGVLKDPKFKDALNKKIKNKSDLILLATIVYFNKYLSSIILKDVKGPKASEDKLKEIYKSKPLLKPAFDYVRNEIKLIPNFWISKLKSLAEVKNLVTGKSVSIQVNDSEGKAQSTQSLSRLYGSLPSQWEMILEKSEIPLVTIDQLSSTKTYKSIKIEFVESIESNRDKEVAIRHIYDDLTKTHYILINKEALERKYNEKAWTIPAVLKDGSQALALPENIFRTFEQFLTFCLEHEYLHVIHKKYSYETVGLYETRINNFALLSLSGANPASGFTLLKPGFYKGFVNIKDVKGLSENREHTKFTVSEFLLGWYLYNFVAGLLNISDVSGKKLVGNGTVGILSSTNSDKNTIGSMLLDLSTEFSEGMTWAEAPVDSIKTVVRSELGEYYIKMYNSIGETYAQLQEANPDVTIDWYNNFELFNYDCKTAGISASKKLFDLTLAYNKLNPLNPIELIDLTHFIKDGKTIRFNNSIRSLINLYYDENKFNKFMKLKELDLLKTFLDEDGSISLLENAATDPNNLTIVNTPKQFLLGNAYKDWVGENYKMILAKIIYNGKTYNITNKNDLYFLNKSLGGKLTTNLHALKDVLVQLHPLLLKWNYTHFLFSLEFLMSSVGSHTNHPEKAKLDKLNIVQVNQIGINHEDFISYDTDIYEDMLNPTENEKDIWEYYQLKALKLNKILVTSLNCPYAVKFDMSLSEALSSGYLDSELHLVMLNAIKEDSARCLALNKRNVSLTAQMYPFQRNNISGPPTTYNIAPIDDIEVDVYTLNGINDSWPPLDGATFVNPLVVYWENNSLEGSKVGTDKKPFVHFYNMKTGTGGIIKTAGFGVTNDLAKQHKFYRIMAYNMMHYPWKNLDGSPHIVQGNGILEDFNGDLIDYGTFYEKRGSKYFAKKLISYEGDNTYKVEETEVDEYGSPIEYPEPKLVSNINSNYDVWLMFGGWNSMELNLDGILVPSENSILLTSRAAIVYGLASKHPVETAEDVYQPMKHSDMHWMPTSGAMKLGIANMNPNSAFYEKTELNHMRINLTQAGVLLDKEHHADLSELSLMTLVMSAAAAKGYKLDSSTKLYKALHSLTQIGTKDFRTRMGNITTDADLFDAAASKIIMEAILNSQSSEGEMVQYIASELIRDMLKNRNFKLTKEFADSIDSKIPYSNRAIYKKIVTILTSSLTKAGIKQKMDGVLAVLKPTQDVIKLYKVPQLDSDGKIKLDLNGNILWRTATYGKLDLYFDVYEVTTEEEVLLKIQELVVPIYDVSTANTNISKIDIGKHYIVTRLVNGVEESEVIYLDRPNSAKVDGLFITTHLGATLYGYRDLKLDSTIVRIQEYISNGLDLKSYNVRFTAEFENETGQKITKEFQIADIDVVQDYFDLKKEKGLNLYNKALDLMQKYGRLTTFKTLITKDLKNHWLQEKDTSHKRAILELIAYLETHDLRSVWGECNDRLKYSKYGELFQKYILNLSLKVLHREMLLVLNAISPSNSSNIEVIIDGNRYKVDKSSIVTLRYGAIMPKTFKSSLGLESHDDLETIKHDPDFFVKRIARRLATKVNNYTDLTEDGNFIDVVNYHLELKRANGNHIYIRLGLLGSKLTEIPIQTETDEEGNIYRVIDGNRIYQLASSNDKVYVDYEGNEIIVTSPDTITWKNEKGEIVNAINTNGNWETTTGHKIVETGTGLFMDEKTGEILTKEEFSSIQFYLDKMSYNSFYINPLSKNSEFSGILTKALSSSNNSANKLAKHIQRLGKNEKDLKNTIKKLKEYFSTINDYLGLLEKYESLKGLPENSVEAIAFRYVQKLGRRIHTSFLKSLNILAARIPSLNLASFMGMEVELYDNPDINSAHVSTMQFYLQGSDLDIDAVSLQTYTLSQSGLFVGHSPYYLLESPELQKLSESIPFPSGESVRIRESFDDSQALNSIVDLFNIKDELLDDLLDSIGNPLEDGFIDIKFIKGGKVEIEVNLNSTKLLKDFIDFLNANSKIFNTGSKESFIKEFKDLYGKTLSAELAELIENLLIALINKHNLHITNSSVSQRSKIMKNYATQLVDDIITDPINLQQALSSVDGVTAPVKDLAKKSSNAAILNSFSVGSIAYPIQSIYENMAGKDGIAICATAIKAYFALTQTANTILNGDNLLEKESLLFNVNIGGKSYKGLSNIFCNKLESWESDSNIDLVEDGLLTQQLKDYLIDLFYANDASGDLSALLGLSADNAKELVLAKLNADTTTLGMYLYGLSIGVPFDTLYNIIASPLGKRLVELTKGNLFENNSGTFDIIGALDYIMVEPFNHVAKYNDIDLSYIQGSSIRKPVELLFPDGIRKEIINLKIEHKQSGISKEESLERIITHLQEKRSKIEEEGLKQLNAISEVHEKTKIKYKALSHQLIDFAILYALDIFLADGFHTTIYGSEVILKDFERLALGAQEMKRTGLLLKLNQKLPTDPLELLQLVGKFEDLLVKRISQIRRSKLRNGVMYNPPENLSEEDSLILGDMLESKGGTYKIKYKLNLHRFLTDPDYASDYMHYYDLIKASFNPLKIFKYLDNYKGYLETLDIAYESSKNKIAKFRAIAIKTPEITQEYKIHDENIKKRLETNIEYWIDSYLRKSWMLERYKDKLFTIKAGSTRVFINSVTRTSDILLDTPYLLGTDVGDANFKVWMEEVVIPELQLKYPNNKFVLGLEWGTSAKSPITGLPYIVMGLGNDVNMLPNSDYDREVFNEYKQAFNDLIKVDLYKDANGTDWSVLELLYLYSLITTNGKIGPNSLHAIFTDYLYSDVASSFHKHISKFDLDRLKDDSGNYVGKYFPLLLKIPTLQILPLSSPYIGGATIIRQLNRETEEIEVWEINDDDYDMDPNAQEHTYSINGYTKIDLPLYLAGFNTDYFTYGYEGSDLEQKIPLATDPNKFPELLKYAIYVLGTDIISILAKDAKDAETVKKVEAFKEVLKNDNFKTIMNKLECLDIQRLNDQLSDIQCLSVL